ncbi:unnamed protein product [Larinioides sclopetarius]|uniref:Uncharacterized protein n=1 Tax=Larinioides sclopetarius TaxID=280406 RepID=A0AAV1Z984_9ARAC
MLGDTALVLSFLWKSFNTNAGSGSVSMHLGLNDKYTCIKLLLLA